MHLLTPEQLFAAMVTADAGRPFVTYYDEASGERSELSVRSLANWVAKTHFLLTDELGLGVGDGAMLAVPAHWISVPVVLGCLTAGLTITGDPGAAAVAFVTAQTAAAAHDVPDVYAVAPDSAALGWRDDTPAGTHDYVAAVRPQADAWAAVRLTARDDDEALAGRARGELVALATARAAEVGAVDGARVLTTRDWSEPDDLVDTLFVPLVVGGSVVFVRNAPSDEVVRRRAEQERATVRV